MQHADAVAPPTTEKGQILRDLADATDLADAFRDWDMPTLAISFVATIGMSSLADKALIGHLQAAFVARQDELRADAQAVLDAKVEELYARFRVLVDGDAPATSAETSAINGRAAKPNLRVVAGKGAKARGRAS